MVAQASCALDVVTRTFPTRSPRRRMMNSCPGRMPLRTPPFRSTSVAVVCSTVAWGKVEIARREKKPLPEGWALDQNGLPTTDPEKATYLTPLGATRELGSHKGYGLALLVEVLCGQLAGSAWSRAASFHRPRNCRTSAR